MENSITIESIRARLEARCGQYGRIAELADVSYSWLCKFAQGKKMNPTFNSIQSLLGALDQLDRENDKTHSATAA